MVDLSMIEPDANFARSQAQPRVLIVAELANPEWMSVPLVGWSHSQAIGALADTHVVTHIRNREGFLRAGRVEGKDFTAIDSSKIFQPVENLAPLLRGGNNKGWTTLMALSALPYYYFENQIWKLFGQQIADREFDIVHRLTPLSPTLPSLLASKCHRVGVPFILGPLNGGLPWPKEFDAIRRQENEWLSYIRWVYRLLPGYRSTRQHAAAIITGSRDTWKQIPNRYRDKCVYVPENGIDLKRFPRERIRQTSRPIKVVFIGRLVPYKGADMLIEAAAPLIRDKAMTLDIVGEGPDLPKLKAMVEQEGIADGVKLVGVVEPNQVQDWLANADVFAFPSIREFGGAVVLEAMAMGLLPIVVNYGGPGELVTESTGYAISMGSRAEIVARFREVLSHLAADPNAIAPMAQRARQRALSHFTWDAKARQTFEVYRWVLGYRTDKPEFGVLLDI